MDSLLRDFLASGKKLLNDTKEKKIKTAQQRKKAQEPLDADPHKNFIRRVVSEKPKKAEVVEDIKKFIKGAEEEL